MDLAIAESMIKNDHENHKHFNTISLNTKNDTFNRTHLLDSKLTPEIEIIDFDEKSQDENEASKIKLIDALLFKANQMLNLKINHFCGKCGLKTVVKFFVVFLRLGEIDNVQERFHADAYIESYWEDNSIKETNFDPNIHWEPQISIANAIGNLQQEIKYKIERVEKSTRIYELRRVKGFFWEKLELQNFPLDEQDLSITVSSLKSKEEVQFELSDEKKCLINTDNFQQQQEWLLFTHINSEKICLYDQYNNFERPALKISSKIARRPGFFFNNAYMLIFFISVLGFMPFSFPVKYPHYRIQTTLLLILSSVNFRWSVTQRLPSISYLTILDKYAISSLFFLALLCCWHAIIGSDLFSTNSMRDIIDLYFLYTIGAIFVIFHILYISMFVIKFLRYKNIGIAVDGIKDEPEKLNESKIQNLKPKLPLTIEDLKKILNEQIKDQT